MALVLIFDLAPTSKRWPASPAMSYGGTWRCMDEHYKVWDARLEKDDTYWCFERDKPK